MSDLVLRRYDPANPARSWCLQLRRAGMAETEYITLATGDEAWAREIVEAGAPFWLHGEPEAGPMTIEEMIAAVRDEIQIEEDVGYADEPELAYRLNCMRATLATLQQYERAMRVVEAARQKIEQVRQRTPHLMLSGEDQRIADALAALDSPSLGETG